MPCLLTYVANLSYVRNRDKRRPPTTRMQTTSPSAFKRWKTRETRKISHPYYAGRQYITRPGTNFRVDFPQNTGGAAHTTNKKMAALETSGRDLVSILGRRGACSGEAAPFFF